eukprot:214-Heterococcus_DN1.PRE.2
MPASSRGEAAPTFDLVSDMRCTNQREQVNKFLTSETNVILCVRSSNIVTMVATRAQKRAVVECGNPLNHDGILELVLSNLLGHGLFVRTVSKSWKACYEQLMQPKGSCTRRHVHSSDCTTYAAAFASPATLLWAHDWNLQLYNEEHDFNGFIALESVQCCAGRYADIPTLQTANLRGLAWTQLITWSAAQSGSLPKLV